MNIEIKQRDKDIRVITWRHRNHCDAYFFPLGTQFSFNGGNEFIATQKNQIVKPTRSVYDYDEFNDL